MDNYKPKQQPQQQQQQPPVTANYNQAPYYGQVPTSNMPSQQGVSGLPAAAQEPLAQELVAAPVETASSIGAQQPATASKSREVTSTDVEQLAKSVSGMNVASEKQPGQASKLPGTGEHLIKNNNRGNRNSKINVRYNAHGNQPNNTNNRVVVPKSDFDFESSNAKFDKDHILQEVSHPHDDENAEADNGEDEEEVVIPPPDDFYNRSKSFFDNISCEAKERSDGPNRYGDNRRKYHEERKLNVETFGQASVEQGRHRGYRGRGGHRGRQLHGGYRGGNRRGGHNRQQQQSQQQQNQQSTTV
jgi:protein LSM14